MPPLPFRWFLILVGVFLASVGADLYLNLPGSSSIASTSVRLNAADFLSAASNGELSAGTITYRMNAAGLADLAATRTQEGKTASVQTTARLTDADLTLLRSNHFTEDDAAALAKVHPATWRERSAAMAHATMQDTGVSHGGSRDFHGREPLRCPLHFVFSPANELSHLAG